MQGTQRVAQNSLVLFIARAIESVSGIVTIALLTRYLKIELFGEYAWIWAFILFFQPLVNFELNTLLTRELAKHPTEIQRYLGVTMVMKWLLLFFFLAAVIVSIQVMDITSQVAYALLLTALAEVLAQHSMLFTGVFTALERMHYEMVLTLVYRALSIGGILLCMALDLGFAAIFATSLVAALVKFLLGARIVHREFAPIKPVFERPLALYLASEALLVTCGSFLTSFSFRIDIYILKWLRDATQVSLFHLPHTIILQLQIIPVAVVTAMFPLLARWGATDLPNLRRAWFLANKFLVTFGGALCVVITCWSGLIVRVLGGKDFQPSAQSLNILIWCGLILFLNFLSTYILIALGRQRYLIVGATVSLILKALIDIALIPSLGHVGASIGTIVGYLSQIAIVVYFVIKALGAVGAALKSLLNPLGAAILGTVVSLLVLDYSRLLATLAGLACMLVVLKALAVFNPDELLFLRNSLQGLSAKLIPKPRQGNP